MIPAVELVGAGPGQLAPEDSARLLAETWKASGAALLANASLTLVVARAGDAEALGSLLGTAAT